MEQQVSYVIFKKEKDFGEKALTALKLINSTLIFVKLAASVKSILKELKDALKKEEIIKEGE